MLTSPTGVPSRSFMCITSRSGSGAPTKKIGEEGAHISSAPSVWAPKNTCRRAERSSCKLLALEKKFSVYEGFHEWRIPQNGWFIMENSIKTIHKLGGTPISGNLHIYAYPGNQPETHSMVSLESCFTWLLGVLSLGPSGKMCRFWTINGWNVPSHFDWDQSAMCSNWNNELA